MLSKGFIGCILVYRADLDGLMSQNFFSPHQRCNKEFAGANYICSIKK